MKTNGSTTRKMLAAPPNAIYVWCNTQLHYPTKLAQHLARVDLRIVSPGWLTSQNVLGLDAAVVLDPDTELNEEQLNAFGETVRRRITSPAASKS